MKPQGNLEFRRALPHSVQPQAAPVNYWFAGALGSLSRRWLYDKMGRLWWQSNPAEMTGSWVPTAEDAAGWVWTIQEYDWKGRPTVTTLPGGATRENTYGGCGCAGGEVTTVRDERGRRRKLSKDVLGRL
ncbi:MAG TPA: hypothetical protein VJS64_05105, partial [Pyrinomonadaceae bacterium]|nr:hypothetical protein [Pyrinomonadaceae bacterium]